MKLFFLCGIWEIMHLAELSKRHVALIEKTKFIPCIQLTGIIACTAEVIAIPALRHGGTVDSCVGEQRKFVKYLDVLKFFCSCIYSQFLFFLLFCNGKHTTHLPQSLLKHLLPLRQLREGRV